MSNLIKKIIFIIYGLILINIIGGHFKAQNMYRFDVENRVINFTKGIEHQRINGKMNLDNVVSNQYYNYIDFNLSKNDDYQLVSVNAFADNEFGFQTLAGMIEKYEKENPHLEVIAGFNGGFYHINDTGEPRHTHIVDYHVLQPMTSGTAVVLASNTDKSVDFKRVWLDGYEVVVYNEFNEIKFKEQVKNINKETNDSNELSLFFDNYKGALNNDLNYLRIITSDLKHPINRDINQPDYYSYANGYYKEGSYSEIKENEFFIVSSYLDKIIESGDRVVYNARIRDFEDVRYAVGTHAGHSLVINSLPKITDPTADMQRLKHPRTAVGIKENGDPFVIVVDGRDRITPKEGVTFNELAHLMISHGAVEAYNFDGGGSSTLMLRNDIKEGPVLDRFDILNELADGRLRSLSQGYLLVKGNVGSKPIEIMTPDNRIKSNNPTNLYIDNEFNLYFNNVENITNYEINVNGLTFETRSNKVLLKNLKVGENLISVRAKGDNNYQTSSYSETLIIKLHSQEVVDLLNLFKKAY